MQDLPDRGGSDRVAALGILGTYGWTSQQMSKSSPACRPNSLRKAHLASRPAVRRRYCTVIGSGSSGHGLWMPAPCLPVSPSAARSGIRLLAVSRSKSRGCRASAARHRKEPGTARHEGHRPGREAVRQRPRLQQRHHTEHLIELEQEDEYFLIFSAFTDGHAPPQRR
jgi:hypothetical protein